MRSLPLFALISSLTLPLSPALARAEGWVATVLSIGDGDTLRVLQQGRPVTLRLACIDAPERQQSPDGEAAREQLRAWLPIGSSVELQVKGIDRYGRRVVHLSAGRRQINQALVASGAAFVYWPFIAGCDRQTYGRLETEARLRRVGVWAVNGGIQRPWLFRAQQRQP